jgi:hypothetical protein
VYGKEKKEKKKKKDKEKKKKGKRNGKKDMKRMSQVKTNKVQGRLSRCCQETKLHSFINQVQSDNEDMPCSLIFCPLHMSNILYLLILDIPTLWFNSHDHWF